MARVTIEDCLTHVANRFGLVHLAASRVREIIKGANRLVDCDNKDVVTSLREIAKGYVVPRTDAASETNDEDLVIDIPDFNA